MHDIVYHPGCHEQCDIDTELYGHVITRFCDKHWNIFKKAYNIPCPH